MLVAIVGAGCMPTPLDRPAMRRPVTPLAQATPSSTPAPQATPTAQATATPTPVPTGGALVGRVTKAGAPQAGRKLFLRVYLPGIAEGADEGGSLDTNYVATTDGDGYYRLAVPKMTGRCFTIFYDESAEILGGDPKLGFTAARNDEIRRFYGKAIDLATKPDRTASVDVDLAWDLTAFTPADGAELVAASGPVRVTAPAVPGAEKYELNVYEGEDPNDGERRMVTATAKRPSLEWRNPPAGRYVYQVIAKGPFGRIMSPWFALTLR